MKIPLVIIFPFSQFFTSKLGASSHHHSTGGAPELWLDLQQQAHDCIQISLNVQQALEWICAFNEEHEVQLTLKDDFVMLFL